jgi:hypothetical protein
MHRTLAHPLLLALTCFGRSVPVEAATRVSSRAGAIAGSVFLVTVAHPRCRPGLKKNATWPNGRRDGNREGASSMPCRESMEQRRMNKRTLTHFAFGAALVAGAAFLMPAGPAAAAPLAQQPLAAGEAAGQSLVQEAHYYRRRHHRRWRWWHFPRHYWWRPHYHRRYW